MKYHSLLIFLFCLNLHFAYSVNDIYFSKVGIDDGLSQLTVMSIYQDELGRMWFGTREGANLYTGKSMEVFLHQQNNPNSLQSNIVSTIVGDRKGKVYIHSHSGLNMFDMVSTQMTLLERGAFETISYAHGKLWAVVDKTLYYFENGTKKPYVTLSQSHSKIRQIHISSDGRIYLGTLFSLYVVDKNLNVSELITDCSQVSKIYEDSRGNIWVGTWEKGLYKIDIEGIVTNYNHRANTILTDDFIRDICEDNKGYIWIGTRNGLHRLNTNTNEFTYYNSNGYSTQRLSNQSVWALYKDKQGTIWIGTYYGGVNYFNPEINHFTYYDFPKGSLNNQSFPIISSIVEDVRGHLFLCTEGNGLIDYSPLTKTHINYIKSETNSNSLSGDNIKTAYLDVKNQKLWLGMHLAGVTVFDISNNQFKRYEHIKPGWEQSNIVRAIIPYQEKLLIATYNGLFLLDPVQDKITLFSEHLHQIVKYFVDLKIDDNNNLWIASNELIRYNPDTKDYVRYTNIRGDENSISDKNPTKILIDSKKRIWVGTNGRGINLYNEEDDNFIRYNSDNSELHNDFVSNLLESKDGYIVIATSKGFSRLNPESHKIYNYGKENGIPLNSMYNGGMALSKNGELYLAGMDGMISFVENRLTPVIEDLNVRFVNIWINNKIIKPNDDTGILKESLPYIKELKLSHKQSIISIEFSIDNFIPGNKQSFRYKLEGLTNEWNELSSDASKLNFMQLSPGKYKLLLEAFSPIDGATNAVNSLIISVEPPFYFSWVAFLLYFILLIIIIWRIIEFNQSQLLLKTSLDFEKKEKENIEAANQSKLRFFTNISHEFRTPLTLISGQVDMLMQSFNIPPAIYNRILSIKRSTQNMQGLITELLEFRKSEQGHLIIKVSEHDFVHFISEIYLSFYEHSKYRQIDLFLDCKEEELKLWFDPIQMQKVFYNLISNALKYTPKKGKITIEVYQELDYVVVNVTDSGMGMKPDEVSKIFDRFYQAENGLEINLMSPGTGIGLALTKNILELHGAEIDVNSRINVGSQFKVRLKKGSSHFADEQKETLGTAVSTYENQIAGLDADFLSEITDGLPEGEKENTILIVEDSMDLMQLLKQIFEPFYNIITAEDGKEGLEKTLEMMPDLVLSDLMMPEMSGSEMCSKIKNHLLVSHIPVVLLTAQTALEYNLEGFRMGADDYITKPFNVKALITRCNNLINGRKILQEKFSKNTNFSTHLIATNRLDQEFLEKAYQIIDVNLDNPDFNIDLFASEMALGRTNLFSKIKGITGQTPNDFILNVKLKKASSMLLANPDFTVSEIAYKLGFNTPKYFAKCFKDQFGVTPTEYRKTND